MSIVRIIVVTTTITVVIVVLMVPVIHVLSVVVIVAVGIGPTAHAFSVDVVDIDHILDVMCVLLLISLLPGVSEVLIAGIVVVSGVLSSRFELSLSTHFNGERVISVVVFDINFIGPWILVSNVVFTWIHSIEHVSWLDHHGA